MQKHLTIWIAGASEAAMRRAVTFGDAWHPNVSPLDKFTKLVAQFRSLPGGKDKPICVRIGLNTKAKESTYFGPQGDRRIILARDMTENKNIIAGLQKLGVSYMLLSSSPEGKTDIAVQVESLRAISENFIRKSSYIA
jgi:hypothetical protein